MIYSDLIVGIVIEAADRFPQNEIQRPNSVMLVPIWIHNGQPKMLVGTRSDGLKGKEILPPGGDLKEHELNDPISGLIREVVEETGMSRELLEKLHKQRKLQDLGIFPLTNQSHKTRVTQVYIVYFEGDTPPFLKPNNIELTDLQWIPLSTAMTWFTTAEQNARTGAKKATLAGARKVFDAVLEHVQSSGRIRKAA